MCKVHLVMRVTSRTVCLLRPRLDVIKSVYLADKVRGRDFVFAPALIRNRERFRENGEKCSPPVLLVHQRMATIAKKSDSALMQTLLTGRSAAGRVDSRRAVSL